MICWSPIYPEFETTTKYISKAKVKAPTENEVVKYEKEEWKEIKYFDCNEDESIACPICTGLPYQ